MKRFFDIVVAIIVGFAALPMFLCVACLIKFKMGSPIIFRQERPGKFGCPFVMIKFRTMRNVASGGVHGADADRLTDLGKILRATSLDELPEIWNVLKGDMSLVGPRPLLMEYLPLYSTEEARRHDVRPGITGWAQVNGRNALSWHEKFALDVWYVDNQSFWLDLKILWLTVVKVFRREGINAAGEATMSRFEGGAN